MKLEYSLQIFEKFSGTKFHENPSSGSRVVPCGRRDKQTDRHDEAKSPFFRFANATKNGPQEVTARGNGLNLLAECRCRWFFLIEVVIKYLFL